MPRRMKPRALSMLPTPILALALGASGPLRAFAHGGTTGLTAMVICGEGGARTVHLDDAGYPVEPGRPGLLWTSLVSAHGSPAGDDLA